MEEKSINKNAAESFLADLDDRYLDEVHQMKGKGKVLQGPFGLVVKCAACFALAVIVGFSSLSAAAAAGSLKAYELLYALDPVLAEKMSPVMESAVDQGIEMKVAGIYVHGKEADIYVTMQDLEGSRIDATTDLFDSYSIHTNCDQWGGCSLVDFDVETHTATFLIQVGQDDEKIGGKKMIFSVSQFLAGKRVGWVDLPEIELSELLTKEADHRPAQEVLQILQSQSVLGYGGETELKQLLVPNKEQIIIPAECEAKITAYGMVEGKLHVQVYYEDVHNRDDHGYIQLVDAQGVEHDCETKADFWDKDHIGRYEEYEFDMSPDELAGCRVIGYFSTGAQIYKGDWKISFPIVNMEEESPASH